MSNSKILFVTDPLCSWCWAMAPEIKRVQESLAVEFGLLLGGLGLDVSQPLTTAAKVHFRNLWDRVAETTQQSFSGRFPAENFVYNSTSACAAVLAARGLTSQATFAYLDSLQARFFLDAENINNVEVQVQVAVALGFDKTEFCQAREMMTADTVASEFASAKGYGSNVLPTVLLEDATGQRHLIAGGYTTAEFLLPEIDYWLTLY